MHNTALLLPFILSSLVTTTFSLSCTECLGATSKTCQGASVTCPTGFDACVATVENYMQDGNEMTLFRQYCGEKKMCSFTGSLTTNFGSKKVASSCCYTSNCSPSTPKLPEIKTDKNQLFCDTCNTDKGAPCDSSMTRIECSGNDKECVTMTNVTTIGTMSSGSTIRGCGTSAWCQGAVQDIKYGEATTSVTIACTQPFSGTSALHAGVPLMLLAIVFILKVIS